MISDIVLYFILFYILPVLSASGRVGIEPGEFVKCKSSSLLAPWQGLVGGNIDGAGSHVTGSTADPASARAAGKREESRVILSLEVEPDRRLINSNECQRSLFPQHNGRHSTLLYLHVLYIRYKRKRNSAIRNIKVQNKRFHELYIRRHASIPI